MLQGQGAAAADANLMADFAKFDYYVKNVYAEVEAAGVTGNMVVDVHKDGTTIFDAAGKITFAAATTPDSYSDLAAGMNTGNKGDKFSLDIDSIHSGTAAEGLIVHIVLTRKEPRGGVTPSNVAPSALVD